MSAAGREDFLERARAAGMASADALLFADLARHAARKAWESIEIVAATVPNRMLQMQIKLNACNMLHRSMLESLVALGPIGSEIRAQFEAHNLTLTESPGPASADPEPRSASLPGEAAPIPVDPADKGD